MKKFPRLIFAVAGLALASGSRAWPQEVTAVLSSDSPYYREALQGFQEAFDRPVQVVLAGQHEPLGGDARVVVAFGKKAAVEDYPPDVTLVYCMSPGTTIRAPENGQRVVNVRMVPSQTEALDDYRRIQPSLKRLAVLWSEGYREYVAQLTRAGGAVGIQVVPVRIRSLQSLPDHLRALQHRADALWVLPDPRLVNEETVALIKDFSWANDIPFYAPTAALVDKGAAGSISPDFREVGRTAAWAALQALSGEVANDIFYPQKARITLNPSAATKAGLTFSPEILRQADQVLP